MPTPREDESKDAFIERCMSSDEAMNDFPDQDQRFAFCQSEWGRNNTVNNMKVHQGEVSTTRTETLNGREHLVVETIALVEGVLQAANSPTAEFVPAEEFGSPAAMWNGRPVTMGHPERGGQLVPANEPDIHETEVIGTIFNAEMIEDRKLKLEAWIDKEKVKDAGEEAQRALQRLQEGEMVEVSTGYFADARPKRGQFDNQQFTAVQQNIKPDHLAILPEDQKGACSVEDGCGANRSNMTCNCEACMTETTETFNEEQVAESLFQRLKNFFQSNEKESRKMNVVEDLISRGDTQFNEQDRATLMEMDEKFLEKMVPLGTHPDKEEKDMSEATANAQPEQEAEVTANEAPAKVEQTEQRTPTFEEVLGYADKDTQDAINRVMRQAQAYKESRIKALQEAKPDVYTNEELQAKSTDEIDRLCSLAGVDDPQPDYSGRGGPRTNTQAEPAPKVPEAPKPLDFGGND